MTETDLIALSDEVDALLKGIYSGKVHQAAMGVALVHIGVGYMAAAGVPRETIWSDIRMLFDARCLVLAEDAPPVRE